MGFSAYYGAVARIVGERRARLARITIESAHANRVKVVACVRMIRFDCAPLAA